MPPFLRVVIEPSAQTGLTKRSQVMVDKPQTPSHARIGPVIGTLDDATLLAVDRPWPCFSGSPDDPIGIEITDREQSGRPAHLFSSHPKSV